MNYTPENITELQPDEIFIFGSNENGNHIGGAAKIAYEHFGAIMGKSVGHFGQSYAIPTLDRDMQKVESEELYIHLQDLIDYVRRYPKLKFYLTKIGCGIAGWGIEEVKNIFWEVLGTKSIPKNLFIPKEFDK